MRHRTPGLRTARAMAVAGLAVAFLWAVGRTFGEGPGKEGPATEEKDNQEMTSPRPLPPRAVVLTFDDGNASDLSYVSGVLKRFGFSATFFITEGLGFGTDAKRLTWAGVKELAADGFEIGNHTRSHVNMVPLSEGEVLAEIEHFERSCKEHGLPNPTSFCYPGYHSDRRIVSVLQKKGYRFARRGAEPEYPPALTGGRGPCYDVLEDHPLLVPTTFASGPNGRLSDLVRAVQQAREGRIPILTFHGVPDPHPHCSTAPSQFTECMQYLHDQRCTVMSFRDLASYVEPPQIPPRPYEAVKRRLEVTPANLRCEYAAEPLGIDTPIPRFSWALESTQRAQAQRAYQILVAGSEALLAGNTGDCWDSGRVESSQSVNVEYQGRPLASGQRYYWKVRSWYKPYPEGIQALETFQDAQLLKEIRDEAAGPYSRPATFETGLLEAADWKAQWIAAPDRQTSAPLLRKVFTLDQAVKRARVYVSGLGYYELHVNGRKVGDHVLDPATSYYHHDQPFELHSRVLYVAYDVTRYLLKGPNAVGVMLGHGWYSAEKDIPPAPVHRTPYGDRPVLLLQMNIELANGDTQRIVSDASWRSSPGPIVYNDLCNGETYDARLERPGWDSPDLKDADGVSAAVPAQAPNGVLRAQMLPPIKVMDERAPQNVTQLKKGVSIYDFGQNFSGWTRLRARGRKGARIVLRYAQNIFEDGRLDTRSNREARQTDTYILRGAGAEEWEPRFTLHGFRYVEVSVNPEEAAVEELRGRVVHSSIDTVGHFECSNPLINRIHQNACWTLRSSFQGIPQDAAERNERVAWLGDPGFVLEDYMYNFDTAAFWTKWLNDIRDSQQVNGNVPFISPPHWRGGYQIYGGLPEWKSTYPLLVWNLYWHYDDRGILKDHYENLAKLVEFRATQARRHIMPGGIGDHMEPQGEGVSSFSAKHTPTDLTATAYYYYDVFLLSRTAQVLGREGDARRYAELARDIKAAFNAKFFDLATNQYGTASQTCNALPLYLGLVPEGREEAVAKNLIRDIQVEHKGHLSTGIIGSDALAHALPAYGGSEVMYGIVTQTTCPSWGYQVSKGATTVWETWQGDPGLSFNMKMFASAEKFFYAGLAGIRPTAPGYGQIQIAPQVVGDLTFVRASIQTIRGRVAVDWKRNEKAFEMDVAIPVSATAQIRIPTLGRKDPEISEGGQPVWRKGEFVKGLSRIRHARAEASSITFDVSSGTYAFNLREGAGGK